MGEQSDWSILEFFLHICFLPHRLIKSSLTNFLFPTLTVLLQPRPSEGKDSGERMQGGSTGTRPSAAGARKDLCFPPLVRVGSAATLRARAGCRAARHAGFPPPPPGGASATAAASPGPLGGAEAGRPAGLR